MCDVRFDQSRRDQPGTSAPTPTGSVTLLRQRFAALLSGVFAFIKAVPASLLAFVTVWLFAFFPWLRPWTPQESRQVSIANAAVAERAFTRPESREEVTVVTFEAESVGYAADPITVATMWIDPTTERRVEPHLVLHGNLVSTARSNKSVGWLDVPYPTLPDGVQGCLKLRVLLLLAPKGGFDPEVTKMTEPDEQAPLLAYADTPAFEPFEDGSCAAFSVDHTTEP